MDTNLLDTKFARIGARLKIADRPPRRNRTSGPVSLDIQADRKGEFFEIVRQPGAEVEVAVLDVQPADRHLLLLVREGKDKSKFLCGHDERHWFVAGIPEDQQLYRIVGPAIRQNDQWAWPVFPTDLDPAASSAQYENEASKIRQRLGLQPASA